MESRRTGRSRAIVLQLVAILAVGSPAAIAAGQSPTPTPTQTSTPTPGTVSISPSVATISFPLTTTTVDVNIDNATGAQGYLIQIAYDSDIVQETAVSDGSGTLSFGCLVAPNFACSNAPDSYCLTNTDCPGGTCVLVPGICAGGSNGGNPCTVNGDCPNGTCVATVTVATACTSAMSGGGTLFHVTFTGLANGSSNLTFTTCQLTNSALATVNCNSVGGEIVVSGYPPPSTILVCDVTPSTGSDFGQFGNGVINNADVVAIFRASLLTPPPAGSALFSAMDSVTVDTPPVCGGDNHIKNNDVVACFQRSLLGGPNFTRTYTGGTSGTCTSAQQ